MVTRCGGDLNVMTMRLYHSSTFVLIWAGQSFGSEDQEDDQEDQEDDQEDQEDDQEGSGGPGGRPGGPRGRPG